jgi:protease-4
MNSVLDALYGTLVQTFSEGRKKTPEEMRKIIDDGPFTAKKALSYGLVDALLYEDQVYGELTRKLGQKELKKLSHRDYARAAVSTRGDSRKSIALVVGDGAISRGTEVGGMNEDDAFSAHSFVKLLRRVGEDSSVKGVILRIDSPGGDAIASDDILREVQLLSKTRPMWFTCLTLPLPAATTLL